MKKLIALLLVLTMALCMAACGEDKKSEETSPDTTPVVTTTPEPTTVPEETKDSGLTTYTVKVVDEAGNPILDGVAQACTDTNCIPDPTNENGVFSWDLAKDNYKVSFIKVPAGFVAEDAYYFDGDSTEMTIVLKAAA